MFSKEQILTAAIFLNYFALLLCAASLYLMLLRYHFPRAVAASLMLATLLINVPVARTLIYSQVNLWVCSLIFLAVILYHPMPFLSAFLLTLAANLKVTPLIIVGAFVVNRDWKWVLYFAVSQLSVVVVTSLIYSFDYWKCFVAFVLQFGVTTGTTLMRNSSFDALVAHTLYVLGISLPVLQQWLVIVFKAGFTLAVGALIRNAIRKGIFVARDAEDAVLLNGLPLFMVLAVMTSPLVWEHHFVLMVLPVLVVLNCARGKRTVRLLLLVYGSLFLLPVFDVYPFSLHRLVSVLLYVYATFLLFREDLAKPSVMEQFGDWLQHRDEVSRQSAQDGRDAERTRRSAPHFAAYYRRLVIIRCLNIQVQAGLVLDVGCDDGYLLSLSPERLNVGVDLRPRVKPSGRLLVVRADGCALPFADNCFSTVLAFDVIEHIVDDDAFVSSVVRALAPGGHLWLSTPTDTSRISPAWLNRLAMQRWGHQRVGYSVADLVRRLPPGYCAQVTLWNATSFHVLYVPLEILSRLSPALARCGARLCFEIDRRLPDGHDHIFLRVDREDGSGHPEECLG
jgi:SAM-dependent methyltransferase/uncharacterized membrane protein